MCASHHHGPHWSDRPGAGCWPGTDAHEAGVLGRSPGSSTALPAVKMVRRWDERCAERWRSLAESVDAIVNLVVEGVIERRTAERKRRIRESRQNAGRAVVQAVELATMRPCVVVPASAVG